MSISPSLKDFLEEKNIDYQVIRHTPTDTSFNAAKSAHIPTQCMVKGVLLRDDKGYLMAAIAATKSLNIEQLNQQIGRNLQLVAEEELDSVLSDCVSGAVPAIGQAFGIPTIWDDSLAGQPSFYIEGGDHEELIRLGHFAFMGLMEGNNHSTFSN